MMERGTAEDTDAEMLAYEHHKLLNQLVHYCTESVNVCRTKISESYKYDRVSLRV